MWETGKREPNSRTLVKLAQFFGISVDDLLSGGPAGHGEEAGAAGRVPVYAALRAGQPGEALGEVVGYEAFPAAAEKSGVYFGLRIPDGAMYPEYQTGDIVIARAGRTARGTERMRSSPWAGRTRPCAASCARRRGSCSCRSTP